MIVLIRLIAAVTIHVYILQNVFTVRKSLKIHVITILSATLAAAPEILVLTSSTAMKHAPLIQIVRRVVVAPRGTARTTSSALATKSSVIAVIKIRSA